LRYDRLIPGGAMRYMNEESHRRYRGMLTSALSESTLGQCQPYFESAIERALDRLHRDPDQNPRQVMEELSTDALLGSMFGTSPGQSLHSELRALSAQVDLGALERELLPWRPGARRAKAVLKRMAEILQNQHSAPMPAAILKAHPGGLDDPVLAANLLLFVPTGGRDLVGLFTWVLKMIASHPQALEGALPRSIVEETLRLEQSEYLFRRATREFQWNGFRIPKGYLIRVCVHEAQWSCRMEEARVFRPTRDDGHGVKRSFGAYRHTCPGKRLTLNFASLFVKRLMETYRVREVGDGPREFDGWHWCPSSQFRVRLDPK